MRFSASHRRTVLMLTLASAAISATVMSRATGSASTVAARRRLCGVDGDGEVGFFGAYMDGALGVNRTSDGAKIGSTRGDLLTAACRRWTMHQLSERALAARSDR